MLELLITKRRRLRMLIFCEHILLLIAILIHPYLAMVLVCVFAAYKLMAIDRTTGILLHRVITTMEKEEE